MKRSPKRKSVIEIKSIPLDLIYKSPKKDSKFKETYNNNNSKEERKNINVITEINESPLSTINSSHRSPIKTKRNSILMGLINDPRFGISKQLKEIEKEAQRKLLIKNRNREIDVLIKERQKLKKILVLSREPYSLRILSNKIMHINIRINKLIKLNDWLLIHPDEVDRQMKMKEKKEIKRNKSLNLDDINFSSMKGDLKKINGYLKINKINKDAEYIYLETDLENIIDKPSFMFQRIKENKLFTPSTEYCGFKRKFGATTIYSKSFKPGGFTKTRNENELYVKKYAKTFEDLYYEIEEKNKNKSPHKSNNNNKYKTIDYEDLNNLNNNYNDSSREKSSSTRPNTSLFNKKKKIMNFKSPEKSQKSFITNFNNFKKNTTKKVNFYHKHCLTERNGNLNFNKQVYKVLNDTSVIKDSIKNTIKEETKAKKDSERVLLTLANRLHKKNQTLEPRKKNYEGETLEDQLINKLAKIPYPAKTEYRKVYKMILNEDRILKKRDINYNDKYENQMKKIREEKKLKEAAYKTMYTLKENILTGKEDKEVFKEEMIFDNYGNIDGLEWLIRKHSVLDNRNKFIGAYNPKEKFNFKINYPI